MVKFWIITICIFLLTTFFLHKVIYKRIKGEIQMKRKLKLFNIYYWESLVALGTGSTFVILLILKSTNILTL